MYKRQVLPLRRMSVGCKSVKVSIRLLISILKMITMETDFLKMVEYATKAPSGHNTQPWRFKSTGDGLVIVPNFDVALPVVDHDNRELYISLGCATENLMISAKHFGYEAEIVENGRNGIRIRLTRNPDVVDDLSLIHILLPLLILKSTFRFAMLRRLNSSFFSRLASCNMAGLSLIRNPVVDRLPPPFAVVMIGLIS